MTMIKEPVKIVRLRPSMLPSQMVATAPKKHPRVYAPTVQVSEVLYRLANQLTGNSLYRRGMALRASWWWVLGIDLREMLEKRTKCEQASHYTLIYPSVSVIAL
jgi:hypothetical protein